MDIRMLKNNKGNIGGFSLIELMVSLTIFSIVMTVGVGTLLVVIDANAKAQALSSSMTNLSFAIDSITRNLRTGRDYYCNDGGSLMSGQFLHSSTTQQDCPGANGIVFTPGFESTNRMAYRLNGTILQQRIDKGQNAGQWIDITSTESPAAVSVTRLSFVVKGSPNGDTSQPSISLLIAGEVQNGLADPTRFEVQSNVTQRVLDY